MKKLIAILLSIFIISTSFPLTAFALESNDYESKILYENVDKRSNNSKTFITKDGTNICAISTDNICYKKNNKYYNIDNSIVTKNKNTLTNNDNYYSIELPKTYKNDSEIKLINDKHHIELSIENNISKSKSKIHNNNNRVNETSLEDEIYNNLQQETTTSEIVYKDIFDNTDLEYQIMSDTVKENIILNIQPKENFSLLYTLNTNGLTLNINEDGSISLLDKGNEIFLINKAVMFDSNGISSDEISLEARKINSNCYSLSYTPNSSWLNEASRKYPVTIDPDISVISNSINTSVSSAYVSSILYNVNYNNENYTYVESEKGNSGTIRETFYNVGDLSNIDSDSLILNANLNVYKSRLTGYQTNNPRESTFNMYMVDSSYTVNDITYRKSSQINDSNFSKLDTKYQTGEGFINFNITAAIDYWMDHNTSNKLLALTGTTSTILSRFNSSKNSNNKPYISIEYVNDVNYSNNQVSHCVDLGYAGKTYINDASGSLSLNTYNFDYSSISSNMNLNLCTNNKTNTLLTNYDEQLELDNNSEDYILTLPNKTYKRYIHDQGNSYHELNTNNQYYIYYQDDDLILEEDSTEISNPKAKKYSDSYLSSITYDSASGNRELIRITRYPNNKINYIQDHTNARFDFEYNNNLISKIIYSNESESNSNNISSFDNVFDNAEAEIQLSYNDSNRLSRIKTNTSNINQETTIAYEWHNNLLKKITDENGITTVFSYDSRNRITKVNQLSKTYVNSNNDVVQDNLLLYTFDYNGNQTIIKDKNGNQIFEKFDENGQLESIINSDGSIEFIGSLNDNFSRKSSKATNYSINYIPNGGFESEKDCCFNLNNVDHSYESNGAYNGKKSLRIYSDTTLTSLIPVNKNSTYTLSCWVKGNSQNSTAKLTAYDSQDTNNAISVESNMATGNNDW